MHVSTSLLLGLAVTASTASKPTDSGLNPAYDSWLKSHDNAMPAASLSSRDNATCRDVNKGDTYKSPTDLTLMAYGTCTKFQAKTNNIFVGKHDIFDNMTFYTDENCMNVGKAGTPVTNLDYKKPIPFQRHEFLNNGTCMHPSDFGEKWGSFKIVKFLLPTRPGGSHTYGAPDGRYHGADTLEDE